MKVGIMGGSFNPIHMGHLMMSEYIRSTLKIDHVLFVPTGNAPHKDDYQVSAEERLNMVKIATADNPYFYVSDIEVNRTGTSYSVDTLTQLNKLYPVDQFYFFLGSDIIFDLKNWKKFNELAKITEFAMAIRPGFEQISLEDVYDEIDFLSKEYGATIHVVETPRYEISSTDLRERLGKNYSVKYLIPDPIIEYIKKNNFYGDSVNGD